MEISANFAFLKQEFPQAAESASYAELHVYGDPRGSCFHARHALERLVARVYKVDKTLSPPKVTNLDGYLSEPAFRELLPEVVWQKAEYIRQAGNVAVHGKKMPTPEKALDLVRELFHVLYWAGRTYLRKGAESLQEKTFDESLVPKAVPKATPASVEALNALKMEGDAAEKNRVEVESELEALRERLAAIKAENEAVPETHDWNEDKTRKLLIDLALQRAGWPLDRKHDREYEVTGMPNQKGTGYADYVLWGDDGKPLAVVEAKKTIIDPRAGQQQAKLYADCLEAMHGQRPIIFYTNGYRTHLWDDLAYPPRSVAGFYKKDELASLVHRRDQRQQLDVAQVKNDIVERYYQKRAIGSIGEQFAQGRRKSLLVMATGSGKTRVAIALVDLLQRAGWVKRTLFLADRVSLVNQAVAAFKTHLPDSSPVNLVSEKDKAGRVDISTYPTMMGLIDETKGTEARFGVGHFDLVIIDEAHRSVYQKYGVIFRYFDSLLVGLTATPREQVDRNTYELFDLEPGVPTDAYELDTAVRDGFLVPLRAQQVDLKFPREGIDYDSLSDEEKEQWENLDWGDDVEENGLPDKVNASAINSWLFNKDTVDKVLQHLMDKGHKVEGGDRLAKTILFARSHEHAKFIEDRFNHHYPHYKGHFARIIDHYAKFPQSLLDDFSQKDKPPHIAISVDMLDTGIDIPEVANLVFFKPVYSKIKFWQMIGRGTRLCPDLFGPDHDKQDFRVFDFCFNFDFFRENPDGIETGGAIPLGTRLFRHRVQLLAHVQATPNLDPKSKLAPSLTTELHGEVAAMNRENFIVRMHLEAVERFRERASWQKLSDYDRERLQREVAGLPSEIETDDIESRMFDLTALRMQLALAEDDLGAFENHRLRMIQIAMLLEEKNTIPAVKSQLDYLASMQETGFWDGMNLNGLEDLRLRLRGLVQFLDKKKRKIVYTDFQDEVMGIREEPVVGMPTMTGAQYEKKVKGYLSSHLDHLVIHRLRANQPLTATDLKGLESTLVEIGEDDGEVLLNGLLARSEAPSLAHFVRSLVGLDRSAANSLFSEFLNNQSLTPPQIRFVEMVIDQLTARGVMEASALYEAPFSNLHAGGPDALFAGRENVISGIFEALKHAQPEIRASTG
ncbi:DEAD/DEAH box helicase family protein [Bauldia litoralis]|uniref:Type I restriction enzyme, R subunit n=1 Tax=Bauldia litoralis TaxID=665467 RepID=A0A1G6AJL4_9HYPH|nr:DEAD/DEAH box helicase family protein [Bauldia litoralis]SDB08611.1 type I restriction enzyme, R subunit [Bauldia litoralis]